MAKVWKEIVERFQEAARQSLGMADFYGLEDAGYAYRALADVELKLARLGEIMEQADLPVPSWLDPEPTQVLDNVKVVETVWGWEVKPKPDGYWDGNIYRSLESVHPTREEAIGAANAAAETLVDVAQREKDAAAAAQVHISTTPVAEMKVYRFNNVFARRPSKCLFWLGRLLGF